MLARINAEIAIACERRFAQAERRLSKGFGARIDRMNERLDRILSAREVAKVSKEPNVINISSKRRKATYTTDPVGTLQEALACARENKVRAVAVP